MPPIDVFYDSADDQFWLADGHYRVNAARAALSKGGPPALRAEVHQGTKRDAFIFAAGANKHGTQLTDEEKRRVVTRLLQDKELRMSDNAIARHVGVSNGFVSGIHRELRDLDAQKESLHEAKTPPPRTTTYVRDGKEVTIRSDKIGRSRNKKAKTETPTTPPVPAKSQVEPQTDVVIEANTTEDAELITAEHVEHTTNDDQEAVTAKNIDDLVGGQNDRNATEDVEPASFVGDAPTTAGASRAGRGTAT